MINIKQNNTSYTKHKKLNNQMSDRELQEYFHNKYHNRKPKQNKARYMLEKLIKEQKLKELEEIEEELYEI